MYVCVRVLNAYKTLKFQKCSPIRRRKENFKFLAHVRVCVFEKHNFCRVVKGKIKF